MEGSGFDLAPEGAAEGGPGESHGHVRQRYTFGALLVAAFLCVFACVTAVIPAQALAADGVYGFVTAANDEGTEYNLVIKNGTDQPDPDTYGVTIKDWSSKDSTGVGAEGVPINLADNEVGHGNAQGGVYDPDRPYGLAYPWRFDEQVRDKIVKVIVPLENNQYVSGLDCDTLFAGLVNCKEFDLTGLDTTGNEGLYDQYGNIKPPIPYSSSETYPHGMFGFYDLAVSTNDGKVPCGKRSVGAYNRNTEDDEIAANAKCKSVEKIITGDKWTLFGFVGLFTNVDNSTYNGKTEYATTFYTTARTNQIVSRTPRYAAHSGWQYNAGNPMFTDCLPAGKHVYYTSKAAAEANQASDYTFCYGSADPASFKDSFTFSSQPFDQANYANARFSSWTATVDVERADGMPNNTAPTFKWYHGTSYGDKKATLASTATGSTSTYTPASNVTKTAGVSYWYADVSADASDASAKSGRTNVAKVTAYDHNEKPEATSASNGQDEDMPVQYLYGEKSDALAVYTADSSQKLIAKYGLEPTQLKTTYQWYKSYKGGDFEPIEGATSSSYTPETRVDTGVYTYYCQITFTINTYAHGLSTVTYTGDSMKFYVEIDTPSAVAGQPAIETVALDNANYPALADGIAPLKVKASVPHGTVGEFKYQWFAKATDEGADDEAVTDATYVPEDGMITFDPPANRLGSNTYYCKVTNEVYTDQTGEDRSKSVESADAKVTIADTFHVKSAADMATLKANENKLSNGYKIELDNDIDLSSDESTKEWTALDLPGNTFDGKGHSITGVNATHGYTLYSTSGYPYKSNAHDGALFGDIVNSTVKNLTVDGTFNSAGIAGRTIKSTVQGCTVKGTVNPKSEDYSTAGITVMGFNAKLVNCANEAEVKAPLAPQDGFGSSNGSGAAGLMNVEYGECTISGCYNAGAITGFNVAAFVVQAEPARAWSMNNDSYYGDTRGDLVFENCYNVGTITSGPKSGSGWRQTSPKSAGLAYVASQNATHAKVVFKSCYNAGALAVAENTNGSTPKNIFEDAIANNTTAGNVTNTYYLATLEAKAKKVGTAVEGDALASADTISALNGTLTEGQTGAWKEGAQYPALAWQTEPVPGAANPVVTDADQTTIVGTKDQTYDPITIKATYAAGLKGAYKGDLSYQWFERTTADDGTVTDAAVDGATKASFTPSSANAGKNYYFCRVTNTYKTGAASTDSALYTVWTKSGKAAATPTFEHAKVEKTYVYGDEIEGLSAAVNNADAEGMGELSYNWVERTTADDGTTNDTVLRTYNGYKGITEKTLTIPYQAGTHEYVCKVTNTYEGTTATAEIVYDVTVGEEVAVSSPKDLLEVAKNAADGKTYAGVTVKLENDIDLSKDEDTKSWTPISKFAGTIDGQGHAIKGLSIVSDANSVGLIGTAEGGFGAKNLTVYGTIKATAATASVGGLTGEIEDWGDDVAIEDVSTDVDITGGANVGGIVGNQPQRTTVSIKNCSNWGNLTSAAQGDGDSTAIGGIVGYLNWTAAGNSSIENCYNRGVITAATMNHNYSGAGGIVGIGRYANKLVNCYNAGKVTALAGDYAIAGRVGPIYGYFSTAYQDADLANNYYLTGSATVKADGKDATALGCNGSDEKGALLVAKTDEEFKSDALVSSLNGTDGTAYKKGSSYPVLSWETVEPGMQARITSQPAAFASYELNAKDVKALSVEGASTTTGYQWYSNSTASTEGASAIEGATGKSITPQVSTAGDTYYFCRVSAGASTVDSNFARVYVASATPAAAPAFTVQPKDVSCTTASGKVDALTAEASFAADVTEGKGEITYQWYKMAGDKPDYGTKGSKDQAIKGATKASYTPSTDASASYYVVATNTFEYAKTAYAISDVAKVTCVNEVVDIDSVKDLVAFRDSVNAGNTYAGKTVNVKKGTYDLSDASVWNASIGRVVWKYQYNQGMSVSGPSFKGVFEGNGSTFLLSSKKVSDTGNNDAAYGLFGYVQGGELKDFTVKGNVTATSDTTYSSKSSVFNAGIVASRVENGSFENVQVSGVLAVAGASDDGPDEAAGDGFGGFAGEAINTSFKDVSADVQVSTSGQGSYYTYVGGIVGLMKGGSITSATASGSVSAGYGDAGGIVGATFGDDELSIAQSINKAAVASRGSKSYSAGRGDGAGGIIGAAGLGLGTKAGNLSVTEVANSGKVSGYDTAGGIVGVVKSAGASFENSYNTGAVTYGTENASGKFGGLAGSVTVGSTFKNCYTTGEVVPASSNAGGMLGEGTASNVQNCWYATKGYPKDATGQDGDELSKLESEDFVATINAVGSEDKGTGSFVYNPKGTPKLWFEKPYLMSAAKVTLESDELAYTGKALTPKVSVSYTVKGEAKKLTEGTDYEVSYKDNIAPGTATVTVTGKGDYEGAVVKTFTVGRGVLTVKAKNCEKSIGSDDPTFAYTVEGLADGDELRYVSFKRAKGEKAGTYEITPQGGMVVRGKTIMDDAYDIKYEAGTLTIVDNTIESATIELAQSAFAYDGTAKKPGVTVKDAGGKTLSEGTDYTLTYASNVNAGTAQVTVKGQGAYSGSATKTYSITKAANTLKASAKAKTAKAKTVKKKSVTVKAITVSKAQGKASYKKASGSKKLAVNAKTGKITVKKGTKKGTYTIKVKVSAAGNANYKSASKTLTVKVKVK